MNPFMLIITEIIYRPIFSLLVIFLAITGGNLWWAIILLTLAIRFILLKPSMAWNDIQKHMADLQPKLQELQEKYKDNPQKLSEETMKLFKQKWWGNILKWCLMMLIQIPVFLWLFFVIRDFSQHKELLDNAYSFLYAFWLDIQQILTNINHYFFWIDLYASGNWILTILAWVAMFLQFKLMSITKPAPSMPAQNVPWMPQMPDMSKFMDFFNYFITTMMMIFVYSMPAGIWLYILVTTLFSLIQYIIQYRQILLIKIKSLS